MDALLGLISERGGDLLRSIMYFEDIFAMEI